ncbi:MAG TPA: allophanate hydrolase [Tepidisphaeraceae bacterium]|nr:allophanate hydrolase [Tepidisphaeraceae bacterium]
MTDSLDIETLQRGFATGRLDPVEFFDRLLAKIDNYSEPAVWIDRFSRIEIKNQLDAALKRKLSGISQPLFGIPFAIKDNIDFAGHATTAGCPAFARMAEQSATAVRKLCDAGAIAVGKTNLDQFATGLVGTRSPYGVCKNPFNREYISGGSSQGSAVAVAAGLVSFALGTDTAGSGRVPAAFNNVVGLKPSRGLISTSGVVPACKSLDCVSILALRVDDARTVFDLIVEYDSEDPYSRKPESIPPAKPIPSSNFRFGVPRDSQLRFYGDREAESLYRKTIERMQSIGGLPVEIDFEPFGRAAELLYAGPWVAERFMVARETMLLKPDALLPVTRQILVWGEAIKATEAFGAMYELQTHCQAAEAQWAKMDMLLLPTAGTIYKIAAVEADPLQTNINLGYYTNFVNLMDLCAVAVPTGFISNGLPLGATLIGRAGQDRPLMQVADLLHRKLGIGPGVSRLPISSKSPTRSSTLKSAKLAVVGAHLSGMPLNHQLTSIGATLVRAVQTAPIYRLYALPNTTPAKPGMVRTSNGDGHHIALEVWEMSAESFGQFVSAIPSPLGIGTIQLEDGEQVQGFLCENFAIEGATDISHFGGWRAFVNSRQH